MASMIATRRMTIFLDRTRIFRYNNVILSWINYEIEEDHMSQLDWTGERLIIDSHNPQIFSICLVVWWIIKNPFHNYYQKHIFIFENVKHNFKADNMFDKKRVKNYFLKNCFKIRCFQKTLLKLFFLLILL